MTTLRGIHLEDERAWEGSLARGGDDYLGITIEDRGTVRLYRGTEPQRQDAVLPASGVLHKA